MTPSYLRMNILARVIISFVLVLFAISANAQSYVVNGNAIEQGNNCYTITPDAAWQNGTVWSSTQLDLSVAFELEFHMNFGDVDANGADGMVFVLQTEGTTAIGDDGSGMGFGGFDPSFGIEFDTFDNTQQLNNGDPASDHVAFLKNGNVYHNNGDNLAGPVQASSMNANIEDGNEHIIKITWDPETETMQLYFDCMLRLSDQNDLINDIFGGNEMVYWGFTGATGFYFNGQTVCLEEYIQTSEDDMAICAESEVQLAISGNPLGAFSWLPAADLDNAAIQFPTASPSVTTEYCCTYTDLCGTSSETCILVEVEQMPMVNAGNDTSFCENDQVNLNAAISLNDALIEWTTTDGQFTGPDNTSTLAVTAAGTYTITATTPLAQCSASDAVEVIETPLPIINIVSPVYLCPDSIVVLDAGAGWQSIVWYNSDISQTVAVNVEGDYSFIVTQNECSNSASFEVIEVTLPIINLGADILACAGETVVLDANAVVTWNTNTSSETLSVTVDGSYTCTFETQGCIVSDEIEINFAPPPIVNLPEQVVMCPLDTIQLSIPYEGEWSNGETAFEIVVSEEGEYSVTVSSGPCTVMDNTQVILAPYPFVDFEEIGTYCIGTTTVLSALQPANESYVWSTDETTPQIEISESGVYSVVVNNTCGSASDSILIEFEECNYIIYAPNAFTPDQDGINDVWMIEAQNLTKTKLTIYDGWGAAIFSTIDLTIPWTGNFRNGEYFVQDGVYNYLLEYWTETGDAAYQRGHITLIR